VEVCDEALGVTPGRTTSSADLGGSKSDPFTYTAIGRPTNNLSR
jgi:hypothetical protein